MMLKLTLLKPMVMLESWSSGNYPLFQFLIWFRFLVGFGIWRRIFWGRFKDKSGEKVDLEWGLKQSCPIFMPKSWKKALSFFFFGRLRRNRKGQVKGFGLVRRRRINSIGFRHAEDFMPNSGVLELNIWNWIPKMAMKGISDKKNHCSNDHLVENLDCEKYKRALNLKPGIVFFFLKVHICSGCCSWFGL